MKFTATFRTGAGTTREVVIEAMSHAHAEKASRKRSAGGGHGAVVSLKGSPWRARMVGECNQAKAKRARSA